MVIDESALGIRSHQFMTKALEYGSRSGKDRRRINMKFWGDIVRCCQRGGNVRLSRSCPGWPWGSAAQGRKEGGWAHLVWRYGGRWGEGSAACGKVGWGRGGWRDGRWLRWGTFLRRGDGSCERGGAGDKSDMEGAVGGAALVLAKEGVGKYAVQEAKGGMWDVGWVPFCDVSLVGGDVRVGGEASVRQTGSWDVLLSIKVLSICRVKRSLLRETKLRGRSLAGRSDAIVEHWSELLGGVQWPGLGGEAILAVGCDAGEGGGIFAGGSSLEDDSMWAAVVGCGLRIWECVRFSLWSRWKVALSVIADILMVALRSKAGRVVWVVVGVVGGWATGGWYGGSATGARLAGGICFLAVGGVVLWPDGLGVSGGESRSSGREVGRRYLRLVVLFGMTCWVCVVYGVLLVVGYDDDMVGLQLSQEGSSGVVRVVSGVWLRGRSAEWAWEMVALVWDGGDGAFSKGGGVRGCLMRVRRGGYILRVVEF
ncbi:hypothetical protein Tco_1043843 [Tanacetum coccineum]|uniref:Uncharacterized protein n=1 Tax=Tanacetum coccineum TaxID=301880 RepID=A0ABQ5GNJ6_9ASTR